jgi:uncharacterized repeat protein (TIGR01451 family)
LTVRDASLIGIYNSGTLTLTNMIVTDNLQGGIFNSGTLTVANSIISRNGTFADGLSTPTGNGGGIRSDRGSLTVIDSTVSYNEAGEGGGISAGENIEIINSTIRNNVSEFGGRSGDGAGLQITFGRATLSNSTVSGNLTIASSNLGGGAIRIDNGTMRLINSTVAYNKTLNSQGGRGNSGGISHASSARLILRNSIIAMNDAAFNIYGVGTLESEGYNLIGNNFGTTPITGVTTGNIVGTQLAPIDARLIPLGFYGGPTETHALLSGSPAINAGNTATSPPADQRGASRVGTADMGAFELNNSGGGGNFVARLPDGVVQRTYSYAIPANRDVRRCCLQPLIASYSVTGGAMPTGISLSTGGTLSGTPTVSGVFNFSVTATSGANSVVTNYRLQIHALPGGSFDSADCSFISGWAWDPQQPNTPISVNIYADDNLVGSVSADQFRQDLLNAGIGNGVHGFSLATPANLKDGQPHQIRVRIVSATSYINGSPKTITCASPPDLIVTKTHTGNFTQGDIGRTYSITVTNSGGTATSGAVSMTDTLPSGLSATEISGAGWNCNFSNLTCTRSDALAPSSSYPGITLTVDVAGNAPGSVINFASVSGGGETNTGNNQAADPTTIGAAPRYAISGTVRYGIPDANQAFPIVSGVHLNQTGTASASAISDITGVYQLSNLLGGNYTVTPSKSGEVRGINSLDATRIQQHLVGMTTLSANQLIAADTDGSGTVNSLDATRIQQRAVGMQTQNIIGEWKFAPASRQYNALGGNATAQDYQAILVGEVSGNWATAASFAENPRNEKESQSEEENEPLPEPADQNRIAERFSDDLLPTETIADDLLERNSEDTKQSSDSSANESSLELGNPVIQVSLPANATSSTGSIVTIPITIGAIPAGSSIESFDFSVFYNATVLQPTSSVSGNTATLSANVRCFRFLRSPAEWLFPARARKL